MEEKQSPVAKVTPVAKPVAPPVKKKLEPPKKKKLFSATLEMTTIHPKVVRFRVVKPNGMPVIGLHHVSVDRSSFPKGIDFSMDFINKKFPKGTPKGDLKRQAAYKMFKKLEIRITTV